MKPFLRLLPHAMATLATFALLWHTTAMFGWLTWHVSRLLGEAGGMHFYSMDVSADDDLAGRLMIATLVVTPLVLVGMVAATSEALRRHRGNVAFMLPPLAASLTGVATWRLLPTDFINERDVIATSLAIVALVLIAVHWATLATMIALVRGRAARGEVAS